MYSLSSCCEYQPTIYSHSSCCVYQPTMYSQSYNTTTTNPRLGCTWPVHPGTFAVVHSTTGHEIVLRVPTYNVLPFVVLRVSAYNILPFIVLRVSAYNILPIVVLRVPAYNVLPFVVLRVSAYNILPFVVLRVPAYMYSQSYNTTTTNPRLGCTWPVHPRTFAVLHAPLVMR
jgi:hypothetical protein